MFVDPPPKSILNHNDVPVRYVNLVGRSPGFLLSFLWPKCAPRRTSLGPVGFMDFFSMD